MRILCFLFLVFSIVFGEETDISQDSSCRLVQLTKRYLGFIHQISQEEILPSESEAESILAPNCRKTLNGKIYLENSQNFLRDLMEVRKIHGRWSVCPIDTIYSLDGNRVVLHLLIDMETLGTYTSMVILRFDESDRITEVNEVFTHLRSDYHFE